MTGSNGSKCLVRLALAIALSLLVLTAGAATARAATSCGVVTAARHSWIIVATGVPCSTAKAVVRRFAARTAAVRSGKTVVASNPPRGFQCVLVSHGKPGGSCSAPGAAKVILWIGTG